MSDCFWRLLKCVMLLCVCDVTTEASITKQRNLVNVTLAKYDLELKCHEYGSLFLKTKRVIVTFKSHNSEEKSQKCKLYTCNWKKVKCGRRNNLSFWVSHNTKFFFFSIFEFLKKNKTYWLYRSQLWDTNLQLWVTSYKLVIAI